MAVDLSKYPFILAEGYRETSLKDDAYNCIAHAVGDAENWWWPPGGHGSYWPDGVRNDVSIEAFAEAFSSLGYVECPTADFEDGWEKVALYAKNGAPTHAARLLSPGKWTHKLGGNVDIETTLKGVEAPHYGAATKYFRRKL